MVAAMRTIIEDILPSMNTDTGGDDNNDDNDNGNRNENENDNENKNENEYDDGNESDYHTRNRTETDTHDSTNTHSGTHLGKNTATDNDKDANIHSTKETMRGRENDNINLSHNIQNKTEQSFEFYPHISPKLADNWDFKATLEAVTFPSNDSINVAEWLKKRRKQNVLENCVGGIPVSEGDDVSDTNSLSDGDISDDTAIKPGNGLPVLDPSLVSTAPTPIPVPDPLTVPTPIPISNPTPPTVPTPVPVPVPVPTSGKPSVDPLGSLAIQMGDFTKIYGHIDQENQFDSVVTCFFIDTASDILEYLAVIAHVLREGMYFSLHRCYIVLLKS